MSTAVAKTLPIGPVQVYWNKVRLGSMKSQAAISQSFETVQQGLQDGGVPVISRRTGERVEVSVVIDDFKISQYRYVQANAMDWEDMDTIQAKNYTATGSVTMRFEEEHLLSGTANATLDRTGFTTGTIEVWSSDWSTMYTRGTDYTATEATGVISREAAGDISDQDVVHVLYDNSATVTVGYGGGQMADFYGVLTLVHVLEDGKNLQFNAWRAKRIGDTETTISLAAEFSGHPITFVLLADMTKNPGKQLFYFAVET